MSSARALFLAMVLAMLVAVPASAHALLVRSSPEADAEMLVAPSSIEMWFSEPLETAFTGARLIGPTGEEIPAEAAVVDPSDATHLSLPIGPLAPGIYTVAWQTLSQVDGHEWFGSFPITILNRDGSAPAASTAVVASGGRGDLPTFGEAITRWLALGGSMLLFGGLIFRWLVIPAGETPRIRSISRNTMLAVFAVSLVAVILGSIGQVVLQSVRLGGLSELAQLLTGTRTGALVLARILLALAGLALIVRAARYRARSLWLLAFVLLFSFSISSHAGAVRGSLFAVGGDLLHLVAASAWIGGLVLLPLAWARTKGANPGAEFTLALRRFSLLAGAAVFVILITGLFNSFVELPSLESLWTTPYGLVLLAKIALVSLAMFAAYLNNRRVQSSPEAKNLPASIAIEAGIAAVILIVVAVLVQTPTPRSLALPDEPSGALLPFNRITPTGDLNVHVQVDPNQAGKNRFWVHLYRDDASDIGDVQLVRLFFEHGQRELGRASVDLEPLGQDTFGAEGAFLSQSGPWDLSVYVRRRGVDDLLSDLQVDVSPGVGSATSASALGNPTPEVPPQALIGALLLIVGLVPILWRGQLPGDPARSYAVGIVLVVIGGLALFLGVTREARAEVPLIQRTNPILPTGDSIARGQEIYLESCALCHGPTGLGDGPLGVTLSPRPANLAVHMVPGVHTDGQILEWISNGFPNSQMPAFEDDYTVEDRWHLINFIRSFAIVEDE